LLRETLLWREKASLQRLRAGSSDRREHLGSVIGTKRADFNRTTVAKMLDGRIIGGSRHVKIAPGLLETASGLADIVPPQERTISPCDA
jgi:hypothetical protein